MKGTTISIYSEDRYSDKDIMEMIMEEHDYVSEEQVDEEQFYNEKMLALELDWYDMNNCLENLVQSQSDYVVIRGDLGLWHGRMICYIVIPSKHIMAQFGQCDAYEITDVDGEFEVVGMHHDGTNYVTFRTVNMKKLPKKYELPMSGQENHEDMKRIFEKYSKKINYVKNVF